MDGRSDEGPEGDADWRAWAELRFASRVADAGTPPAGPPWVAVVVLLLHAGFAWMLVVLSQPEATETTARQSVLVEFLVLDVIPVPSPPPTRIEPPAPRVAPQVQATPRPPRRPAVAAADSAAVVLEAPEASDRPMQVFEIDGRLRVPDDLLEQVDAATGNGRDFAYQVPGLDKAEALLGRRVALEYTATQFDENWRPDQTLLDDILEKAMKATTAEIRIPVPGNPSATLVCMVNVLAMGGGCMIEDHNLEYRVEIDDPATLDPDEVRQCEAWWDQIVGATSQDAWRRTRKLYEAECRKPLLKTRPKDRLSAS